MQYYLSSEDFVGKHEKNIKRVILRLKKYLAEPSEDNIHDLRTAIRRLDASCSVLPKELRLKPKLKKFVKSYKEFFKINSDVRDLDIMMIKLKKFKSASELKSLLKSMNETRCNKLKKGEIIASHLEHLATPAISINKLSQKKLQKRFEKLILPLIQNIENLIPIVIADEQKICELHKLRINCKKLRYLLELVSNKGNDSILKKLKLIQDHLGNIHDNDVLIDFLIKSKRNVPNVIYSEKRKRKQAYRLFVDYINSKS